MTKICIICSATPTDRPWFVKVNGQPVCSECCREVTAKAHEKWLERNKEMVENFRNKSNLPGPGLS